MSLGTLVLFLLGYATMDALPHIFFRRESMKSFNLMWWLTSAPYAVAPILMVLAYLGKITPISAGSAAAPWLDGLSVPFAAASIALQLATMAVHRIPLSLWHQKNDAPQQIVTWGPYGRVRHPFYVSFLLLMVGTVIAVPHLGTLACLGFAVVVLSLTAAREERRLLASDLGHEYADYLKRTGRFIPRLGPVPS
jgi:protein-S-isoprenylcysteine O-methyltransferase Ste14